MRRRDERDVVVSMSIPRILILLWARSPLYTREQEGMAQYMVVETWYLMHIILIFSFTGTCCHFALVMSGHFLFLWSRFLLTSCTCLGHFSKLYTLLATVLPFTLVVVGENLTVLGVGPLSFVLGR